MTYARRPANRWPSRRPSNRSLITSVIALLVAVFSAIDHYRHRDTGAQTAATVEKKAGTVTHVVDGDTIDVLVTEGAPAVRVRLIGIDAPEVEGPSHPFGIASAQYARNRLEHKQVTLRMDELQRDHDKYGRLLAYVYLNDELINQSLIRDGMAFSHRMLRCDQSAQFDAAENEARNAKRGLWKTITLSEMPEWRQKWMAEHGLR